MLGTWACLAAPVIRARAPHLFVAPEHLGIGLSHSRFKPQKFSKNTPWGASVMGTTCTGGVSVGKTCLWQVYQPPNAASALAQPQLASSGEQAGLAGPHHLCYPGPYSCSWLLKHDALKQGSPAVWARQTSPPGLHRGGWHTKLLLYRFWGPLESWLSLRCLFCLGNGTHVKTMAAPPSFLIFFQLYQGIIDK